MNRNQIVESLYKEIELYSNCPCCPLRLLTIEVLANALNKAGATRRGESLLGEIEVLRSHRYRDILNDKFGIVDENRFYRKICGRIHFFLAEVGLL